MDLNHRPIDYESNALTAELHHNVWQTLLGLNQEPPEAKSGALPVELRANELWRATRESNPEPLALEASALPVELATQKYIWRKMLDSNQRAAFATTA